jgi:hypothetical protein
MEHCAFGFDILHGMKPAGRRMNRIAHFQKLHRRLADAGRGAGYNRHLACLIHWDSPYLFIREGRLIRPRRPCFYILTK